MNAQEISRHLARLTFRLEGNELTESEREHAIGEVRAQLAERVFVDEHVDHWIGWGERQERVIIDAVRELADEMLDERGATLDNVVVRARVELDVEHCDDEALRRIAADVWQIDGGGE